MDFSDSLKMLESCTCGRTHEFKMKIEISEGAVKKAGEVLALSNFPKKICVVGDNNTFRAAEGIFDSLHKSGFETAQVTYDNLRVADIETAASLEQRLGGAQGVLAVGTGSVSDVCRMAAFRKGIPYAIFGTAPSMDGFASSNCPMIDGGYKRSYFVNAPAAVIADTKILAEAPLRLKAAGLADVLGKFLAVADWKIAHLLTGEYYCENVANMVQSSAQKALDLCFKIKQCTPKMAEELMQALVLPGLAMAFCGCSRPASGAEHYLSHCWEVLFIRDGLPPEFHGAKVGVATYYMTDIYKRLAKIECPEFKRADIDWQSVHAYYGDRIYKEIEKDFEVDAVQNMEPRLLRDNWDQIRNILNTIPDAKTIKEALIAAGGAVTPSDVSVEKELFKSSLHFCRYIRNRLTTYRLMDMVKLPEGFIYATEEGR